MGMARTVADDNPPMARKLAQQALAVNPNDAGAHVLLAELALDDLKRADAKAEIDKALAINPNHLEALSLSAALAWLEKRTADQTAATDGRAQDQPALRRGVPRHRRRCRRAHYRFDEAAEFARKAIDRRPRELPRLRRPRRAPDAHRRRARRAGARSRPPSAATPSTASPTTCSALLDTLDDFETIRDGDLVIRLHPDEAGGDARVRAGAGQAKRWPRCRSGGTSRRPGRS